MLKKTVFSSEFSISKFLDLFGYCKKDLEKLVLLLKKGIMCCEYIGSWRKLKEK